MSSTEAAPRRRRPLRRRLTLGMVALVAVVLALVGLATLEVLRRFLVGQVDDQLAQTTAQVTGRPFGRLEGLQVGTLLLETTADGTLTRRPVLVVAEGEGQGSATLSADDLDAITSVGGTPENVDLSELGRYRFVRAEERSGDVVAVGLPLEQVDDTLARILVVGLLGLGVAVLTVALVGGWLIRRELRPLELVATTARRISNRPLAQVDTRVEERVALTSSGTEVDDVAEAINEMLDHVDASLDARAATDARLRRFVADASHELRTPLASIRGYAELFRRVDDADPERRRLAMARIESEAQRMGVLVDDLLLLARLDQGRPLARDPVDLARLAVEAAADAQAASPEHPVTLDVPEEPALVLGDEDRLRQVLANLLANVHRHTPTGTPVTVAVAPGPEQVRLSVVDEGPGVPPELAPRAFERFTRGDGSRSRASGGTGLGLSIVSAVVTAHGGTVALDSRPGRTAVVVTLPSADSTPPESTPPTR